MTERPDYRRRDRPALQYERAVNERYQRELRDMIDRQIHIARSQSTTRNQQWTSPGGPAPVPAGIVGPLAGRVALGVDDPLLHRGFYIGPWHEEWDGIEVVSWAAPAASLFYAGHDSGDSLAADVEARRTFVVERSDIVDFVDEVEQGTIGDDPFVSACCRQDYLTTLWRDCPTTIRRL